MMKRFAFYINIDKFLLIYFLTYYQCTRKLNNPLPSNQDSNGWFLSLLFSYLDEYIIFGNEHNHKSSIMETLIV